MAEDLSARVGSFGDPVAATPHIDALAQGGVRYTHTFTTAGVCAPSRAALITGLYQISIGAQHMRTSTSPLGPYLAVPPPEVKAFPELLRAAGYYTFTDTKLDYQFSGVRADSGPFTIWDAEGANTHWRNRPSGQPFFGLINFLETHESGVMRPTGLPHSASHAATQRMRAGYGIVAPTVTDPSTVPLPPYYPDIPEVRTDIARHYDNIRAMDARVGRILSELEADGLTQNTIVIWTTDHGDGLPRAKRELFDSGIRVPMVVRLPESFSPAGWGIGNTDDRMISFVDVAPTLLGLARITPPAYLVGQDFLHDATRTFVFAARDRIDEVPDRQRAVRDRRFKYIRSWYPDTPGGHPLTYRDNLDMVRAMRARYKSGHLSAQQSRWFEAIGTEQLYDLEADPNELVNVAASARYRSARQRMRHALAGWRQRVWDSSEIPEPDLRRQLLVDGEIGITPQPVLNVSHGRVRIVAEPGASIGYQIGDGPWLLYQTPFTLPEGILRAKAQRYGWRESRTTALPSPD